MTIPAIGAISALTSAAPALTTATPAAAIQPPEPAGTDFSAMLGKGLDALQATQGKADTLAVQAATGDLTDISSYTIAATQASLATQLATTLSSRGVEAFNQIMGLQA